jgi:hypothetical protein
LTVIAPSGDGPLYIFGVPGIPTTDVVVPATGVDPGFGAVVDDDALGVAEGAAPEVVVVDADEEAAPALDIIDDACAGEIVCVVVEFKGCDPFPAFTSWGNICGCVSMNASVGPAMVCFWARSWTSLRRGCPSEVINRATGPLMPVGTTHWDKGSGIAVGELPMSIWQNSFCWRMGVLV